MRFVQRHQVIRALATIVADDALGVRVLPRRPLGAHDFLDAEGSDSLLHEVAVDRVAVAVQKARDAFVPGERFSQLLCRLLRRRVLGHIELQDAPPIVVQHDENVQEPKRQRRHGEEVAAGAHVEVVAQERYSRLLVLRIWHLHHVLRNCRLRDLVSE